MLSAAGENFYEYISATRRENVIKTYILNVSRVADAPQAKKISEKRYCFIEKIVCVFFLRAADDFLKWWKNAYIRKPEHAGQSEDAFLTLISLLYKTVF